MHALYLIIAYHVSALDRPSNQLHLPYTVYFLMAQSLHFHGMLIKTCSTSFFIMQIR